MTTDASIGLIGIGAMGLPMATNLQRRGHAPWVRDTDPRAVAAATDSGLVACDSAAALAQRCDTVIVVVVDAAQVDDVLFGRGGVVHAERPASAPQQTVVLCSTIAPDDTVRFCDRLAGHGIATVDAPISGGPARAENGTLSMMVAAEAATFARCEPLLREMASALYAVGERVGDGARVKLVNNLLAGINLVAGAEGLSLGSRLGLDRRLLFDVINASSGASWIFSDRMARALVHDFAPRARAGILTKDVALAVQMAADAGVATPLGEQALAVFRATVAAGFGDADDAAVIRTLDPDF
ncbi:NAD(P)-dependent oxidoreductase [Piscinibacter sp.]|uniref:NAD(P)-dependent oxidoreductase n=1 Tax=Piscinibacter sp. TaxID=1903157 RepID=UPI002BA2B351|nr:NAD(P)-dependent oxidoreductase [Albitalea sp.]HUG22352.1 NAD(P)-dependent oxidoreductase [Albitalea sp.]